MGPVIIAQSSIELQSSLRHGHGCSVAARLLLVEVGGSFAAAVDHTRPGVGGIQVNTASEAAIHLPLQRVIRRIPLVGSNKACSKLGIEALSVEEPRVQIGSSRQLMADSPDVGHVDENPFRQLTLEAQGPALGVWTAQVLLHRARLGIQQTGGAWSGGQSR